MAQDQFRPRFEVPRTALESAATYGPSAAANSHQKGALDLESVPEPIGMRLQDLCVGALCCFLGLLVLRQVAPEATDAVFARLFPRLSASPLASEDSAGALEDEQAFARFLVSFKAGPSSTEDSKSADANHPAVACTRAGTGGARGKETGPLAPFFSWAPRHLVEARSLFQRIQHETVGAEQRPLLAELCVRIRTLREMAEVPDLLPVWQMASVTEGLVSQLEARPAEISSYRLRTVASALDLLVDLCKPEIRPDLSTNPPIRLLAVDDDLVSRSAVGFALKRAFNQPDLAANALSAMAQASMIAYDVIFLDVLMPGIDGFELCSNIHEIPLNQSTPVVFVTSQTDFNTRAKSHLSGGTDLITKPFLTFEITTKALVLALRARLLAPAGKAADAPVTDQERLSPSVASESQARMAPGCATTVSAHGKTVGDCSSPVGR